MRRPETILDIKIWTTLFEVIKKLLFFKDFNKRRKTANRVLYFNHRISTTFLHTGTMSPSNNLENKVSSDTYWKTHLICRKVRAHRTTTRIQSNTNPDTFEESISIIKLGVTRILSNFRLILEERKGKEIPGLWRLDILANISANNFV